MFKTDARSETNDTVVAFPAASSAQDDRATAWPNPRHPLAFQLAMALVERTEYDAA